MNENEKLEEELRNGRQQHEHEVMLRLRFEEKLNNLHSLTRTFQLLSERNGALLQEKTEELRDRYELLDRERERAIALKVDVETL